MHVHSELIIMHTNTQSFVRIMQCLTGAAVSCTAARHLTLLESVKYSMLHLRFQPPRCVTGEVRLEEAKHGSSITCVSLWIPSLAYPKSFVWQP